MLDALRRSLGGPLLEPGDPGYDEARHVWNERLAARPAAVAQCTGAADVMAAVEAAREEGLLLSVKSGGHSYAGHGTCDGGLMLDLSPVQGARIDPHTKTARVAPATRWGQFDHEARPFGLATTAGTVSTVGVAGFVLGGGTGYLARKHGLAADNLVSADVVTAGGDLVHASEEQNPDLFWGLRGGGANLGVVTSLELALHEMPSTILAGQILHPYENAREVLRFYRDFMAEAPDELTCYAVFLRIPPIPDFPEEMHGRPVVDLLVAHIGSLDEAEKAVEPLRRFGDPIAVDVGPQPYVAVQQALDAGTPAGQRWDTKAQYLEELSDEAIDVAVRYGDTLRGAFTMAYFEPMGGAVNRVDPAATAFPHREAAYSFHILSGWTDPAEDESIMEWTRDFHDAMAGHGTGGVYVNLLGAEETERIPAAYGPNYERLARIKAKYDPDNLFRRNQNVEPAG